MSNDDIWMNGVDSSVLNELPDGGNVLIERHDGSPIELLARLSNQVLDQYWYLYVAAFVLAIFAGFRLSKLEKWEEGDVVFTVAQVAGVGIILAGLGMTQVYALWNNNVNPSCPLGYNPSEDSFGDACLYSTLPTGFIIAGVIAHLLLIAVVASAARISANAARNSRIVQFHTATKMTSVSKAGPKGRTHS